MNEKSFSSGDVIRIIIDNNTIKKYNEYYFNKYPRRTKAPIGSPIHPSINVWFIMRRPEMNNLKCRWKDFIVWLIEDIELSNIGIESCTVKFVSYYPTRRRVDVDNVAPKFIIDGLVDAGLIVDDSYKHLKSLTLQCDYDKNNPRTEIFIFVE